MKVELEIMGELSSTIFFLHFPKIRLSARQSPRSYLQLYAGSSPRTSNASIQNLAPFVLFISTSLAC